MSDANNSTLTQDRRHGVLMASLIAATAISTALLLLSDSVVLAAALGIALSCAAITRFELFFCVQIFLLPWYPFLSAQLPLRDVSLVLRFVLFAGVAIIRHRKGKSLARWFWGGWINKGVLAFAAVATTTLLFSSQGANIDALRSLARLFSYLAVFFAVTGWVESREQMNAMIKILLSSTILVAIFGFLQVWQNGYTDLYFYLYPLQEEGLEEWNGRITSLLFHFNSLAGYLNLILPLSFAGMVLAQRPRLRFAALACHSASLAALYFTGSRGGLIAYAAMAAVCLFFLNRKKTAVLRLALAGALSLVMVWALQPGVTEESRLKEVDDFTSTSRLALWGAAGAMFLQHPVLGVGYGNYRSLYIDYIPGATPNQLDAHNLYLQLLSETGIVGFLIFGVMIAGFARMAVKLARSPDPLCRIFGIAVGGALVATLAHGMVDFLFNVSPQFGALFWLLMGLGVVASKQTTKQFAGSDLISYPGMNDFSKC